MSDQMMSPPVDAELELSVPQSDWPRVIGVISIVYAILGLLCVTPWMLLSPFMSSFMGAFIEDAPAYPGVLSAVYFVQGAASVILGILLLIGAVKLLGRNPAAAGWLKTWVVSRLIVLLIAAVAGFLLIADTVDYQMALNEAITRQANTGGGAAMPMQSREALVAQSVIMLTVGSAVVAIYPIFLGIWFSRSKIRDEIAAWPQL